MKTSYIRDFKHNYLVIHDDRVISEDYETRMLSKNRIEGLLGCEERMINGEGFLYYDISSRHTLKSVFSEEIIGFELVRSLFTSMIRLCSEMEKYLLYDDGLILDPEYIYYDIESKEFFFLYYKDDQSGKPGPLFEFLTEHLDNDDFSAVEAVYQMYDMSKRSFYALDEILRWFEEEYLEEKEDLTEAVPENDRKMLPVASVTSGNKKEEVPEYEEWEDKINEEMEKRISRDKKSIWTRIWEFIFKKEEDRKEDSYFEDYYEEPSAYGCDSDDGENNTVFIPWVENSEHKLYGMGKGNKTHIDLSSVPVTIGKMRGAADIILNDESVSRLHAKLMRAGSRFFLLDLNSTNGSFKNGVRLSPNEKVVIEPGDEIGFGKLKFIYR